MFILDEPFVSEECLDYLEESQHPVLANAMGESCAGRRHLNLLPDIPEDTRRIVALSEAPLAWVLEHCTDTALTDAVRLMKDKAAMRRALADIQPGYRFDEVAYADLDAYVVDTAMLPVVLKPAVGFFSMGVYTVRTPTEWTAAVADIHAHHDAMLRDWDASVVDDSRFIVESYIEGREYAADIYYDHEGKAVILDVLQHDFASPEDVSDRLYWTDAALMRRMLPPLTTFFDQVNTTLGFRDLPCHVELREKDGVITPIEFNPLRFAGLCTTDVSWFAYGFRTYAAFLEDLHPDWERILPHTGTGRFAFCMFGGLPGEEPLSDDELERFDEELVWQALPGLKALRRMPYRQLGAIACLILEDDDPDHPQMDRALHMSLRDFVREA